MVSLKGWLLLIDPGLCGSMDWLIGLCFWCMAHAEDEWGKPNHAVSLLLSLLSNPCETAPFLVSKKAFRTHLCAGAATRKGSHVRCALGSGSTTTVVLLVSGCLTARSLRTQVASSIRHVYGAWRHRAARARGRHRLLGSAPRPPPCASTSPLPVAAPSVASQPLRSAEPELCAP